MIIDLARIFFVGIWDRCTYRHDPIQEETTWEIADLVDDIDKVAED